jgi:hypothetical protein
MFWRQRLRWEGDLFYLFVRKYRFNIRPALLGWRNFLFTVVNGVLMGLVMPFFIAFHTLLMLWLLPVGAVLGLLALVYGVYLALAVVTFVLYLAAVSERPTQDAPYLLLLPLMPVFAFACRLHTAVAILQEACTRSHLDSAMAPWWVLRKTKF